MADIARLIEVVLDEHGLGTDVRVNGTSLPFAIGTDLSITFTDRGRLASLQITIPADRIVTADQ